MAKEVFTKTGDAAFAGELYRKAASMQSDAGQLVKLAGPLMDDIQDKPTALEILKKAELTVKTTGEFKTVAETILNYTDDPQWIEDTKTQLEKREAHKELYTEFVKREQECLTPASLSTLAQEVIQATGDIPYTRKLYRKAETLSTYFPEKLSVAKAIHTNLQDSDWVRSIYVKLLETCDDDSKYNNLVDGILQTINDPNWVREIYTGFEAEAETEAHFVKLARLVFEKLDDREWAKRLLAQAEEKLSDRSGCVNLASVVQSLLGDAEWVKSIYRKADTYCNNWYDYDALFRSIEQNLKDRDLLMEAHRNAENKFKSAPDFTHLAESILQRFADLSWARRVYTSAGNCEDADIHSYELAISLANKLNDRRWARRVLGS
jgi:hypothetical protein